MCGGSGGGEGGVDSTQADKDLDENLMVKLQVSILNYQAGIYIFSFFLLSIYWPTTGGGMSNKHGVMQGGHLNIQRKKVFALFLQEMAGGNINYFLKTNTQMIFHFKF